MNKPETLIGGSQKPVGAEIRSPRLDKSGVPTDPDDWTDEDWLELWNGIKRIRARIAKRHLHPNAAGEPLPPTASADDKKNV